MLDRNTFKALNDPDLMYNFYKEAIEHLDYFKSLCKDLTSKIPSVTDDTQLPLPTAATASAHAALMPGGAATSRQLRSSVSEEKPPEVKEPEGEKLPHLSLPKDGIFNGLILGDSITARIVASQVGDEVLVRGFGGCTTERLLYKVQNSRPKNIENITLSIGINDVMSSNFDPKSTTNSYEKLVYMVVHKFSPKNITLCTLSPTASFRKDFNPVILKFNKSLQQLANSKFNDTDTSVSILDMHRVFSDTQGALSTDGLHPSTAGVEALVTAHRVNFEKFGIQVSDCDITVRERQMPRTHTQTASKQISVNDIVSALQNLQNKS